MNAWHQVSAMNKIFPTIYHYRMAKTRTSMPELSSTGAPTRRAAALALSIFAGSCQPVVLSRSLSASAPCHIVDSYYPKRVCRESSDPIECRVAPNAFGSRQSCCASFGPNGCTPLDEEVECFVAGSRYPTTSCVVTTDPEVCNLPHSNWDTMDACCEKGAAFAKGCDWQYSANFSANDVADSCWIASTYHPVRECYEVSDPTICQRGWGSWLTYQECCAPNAAHSMGCGLAD